jgi:hypothetical protein
VIIVSLSLRICCKLEATVTAKAAAAGIVSSIWDLGSALLQNNYLSGDRRLRSGSNLSESSINSDRSTDRDRDRDRDRGVEEVRWVLGALDPSARSSPVPLPPDSRKQAAIDNLKAPSETDRLLCQAAESRNSSGTYSNSDCSYEEGSDRAKGQNSALSAKLRTAAPSTAPGSQPAVIPIPANTSTAPRSVGPSSQSSADCEDIPPHSSCSCPAQSASACTCSTLNGRCASALSASTASVSVSVSTVVSSCQSDKKGADVSPSEPLDSPRGSLQQLLKILSAAAAVGNATHQHLDSLFLSIYSTWHSSCPFDDLIGCIPSISILYHLHCLRGSLGRTPERRWKPPVRALSVRLLSQAGASGRR